MHSQGVYLVGKHDLFPFCINHESKRWNALRAEDSPAVRGKWLRSSQRGTVTVSDPFSVLPQKVDKKKAIKGFALNNPTKEGALLPFG